MPGTLKRTIVITFYNYNLLHFHLSFLPFVENCHEPNKYRSLLSTTRGPFPALIEENNSQASTFPVPETIELVYD
jgi:hypothetical protein